ncbi:HI_0552 family protein [Enterococcus sp. 2201sp1_2201st1_B8_2201SCRN_220225]|uniref:HI_0552 family protein n=1 Tax=unclassified Enterococcus TaxID=2608891 RepID=UPI0034A19475
MELKKADFQLFHRTHFAFKQLKAELSEVEIASLKNEYQQHWQHWKLLQLTVAENLPEGFAMNKPKIESWTNGWNLRNHFWCAYRSENRQKENACLATLLNRKQYQVYVMFQHYQSEKRKGSPEAYNQLLELLPQWSQNVDLENYYIWPKSEDELADHLPLTTYLADEQVQKEFRNSLKGETFQLGKLFFEGEISQAEQITMATLQELMPLYQSLAEGE